MKYLLSVIWKFIKQIPKKVKKLIRASSLNNNIEMEASFSSNAAPSQIKVRRKIQSFKSFLKEDSLSRIRRRKQAKGTKKFKKSIRSYKNGQMSSIQMSIEDYSEQQNKDCFTNEVNNAAIQLQPPSFALFQDNNGLEISVITPAIRPFDQPINRIDDSDEQLLQLITGTMRSSKQTSQTSQTNRQKYPSALQNRKNKANRQWWQEIIERNQNSHLLPARSKQQSSNAPYNGLNPEKRQQFSQQKKEHHIKVISLIDLVEDEDFPKVFEVPLFIS